MKDIAQWVSWALLAAVIAAVIWSTIKRGRDERKHREFMAAHASLTAEMEHARTRINIGRATEDMGMVQAALMDLFKLKERFDGKGGIRVEADLVETQDL